MNHCNLKNLVKFISRMIFFRKSHSKMWTTNLSLTQERRRRSSTSLMKCRQQIDCFIRSREALRKARMLVQTYPLSCVLELPSSLFHSVAWVVKEDTHASAHSLIKLCPWITDFFVGCRQRYRACILSGYTCGLRQKQENETKKNWLVKINDTLDRNTGSGNGVLQARITG